MSNGQSPVVSQRRLGDLLAEIESGKLKVQPIFQRRLVWTNIVKDAFIDTVLRQYPFPEIFVAAGELDESKLKRTDWLVDGQQRLSTLSEYVKGSTDLVFKKSKPYAELTEKQKTDFSDYIVAVRNLGIRSEEEVKEIFSRINSADYSLKKIERLNAQYSGAFKRFCDELSRHPFFISNKVFSAVAIRRMVDLDFCIILVVTMLSTYFHRDEKNDEYLARYNDEFPDAVSIISRLTAVFDFITGMALFEKSARAKKRTDLFTLIVELDALLNQKKTPLDPDKVSSKLAAFYTSVDQRFSEPETELSRRADQAVVDKYLKAATKATNDRYSRIARAEVVSHLLAS